MTTTRSSPKPRQTSTSKTSAPPLRLSSTTLVSASAVFSGTHPVTFGANVIIQIRSRLSSTYGPLNIGEGAIISERASIGLLTAPPTAAQLAHNDQGTTTAVSGVNIGRGVYIESSAIVEAASVGDFTIVEAGAILKRGAVIGKRCKICAKVEVGEGCVVEDGMIVWGSGWGEWRVEKGAKELDGKREGCVKEQGEVLRRVWTGK